ncbi:hypothetical protein VCV18_009398 [Metarhizium anisopliae]
MRASYLGGDAPSVDNAGNPGVGWVDSVSICDEPVTACTRRLQLDPGHKVPVLVLQSRPGEASDDHGANASYNGNLLPVPGSTPHLGLLANPRKWTQEGMGN